MGTTHHQRVLLVGAGRWGRNLARALDELGALAGAVDPDPEARQRFTRTFGAPAWEDLTAVTATVDAAVIAAPAATHRPLALRALERDLDILVEKPLALTVEDAEIVVAEADRRGRILMTGHILLYHPAIETLKALIDAGELGRIRYIYSNRLNLGRVRREENILWSFAPHDVATILHLLGAPPEDVRAVGGSWLQPDIVDVTVTHLEFPGGVKGHVFVSWLHPYKEQKLVVVGSRKMAVFDDVEPVEKLRVMDAGVDVGADGVPEERRGARSAIPLTPEEPLLRECRHFLECCRDRRRPLTDGAHGLEVLKILSAAEHSLRSSAAKTPRRIGDLDSAEIEGTA